MRRLKVSVITPCYNSEKTIRITLESMLHQTYSNIEYIIIDGASTDNTLSIITEFEKKFPFEFKLISEKDSGIYNAMNKGIHMATGDLIGIVNSDDWYETRAIEKIVSSYTGNDLEVVYGMQRNIERDGKEKSVVFYHHDFLNYQMITHPTCFVTKKTYEKYGVFCEEYESSADYEYMLKLYDAKDVVFTPVYSVISNFMVGGMSSSQRGSRETLKIRYNRGILSKKQYFIKMAISYLHEITHKKK